MTFSEWKIDLEKRLAEFLFNNPEKTEESSFSSPPRLSKSLEYDSRKEPKPNMTVKVQESSIMPGLWSVWKDGTIVEQFDGPFAQRDAAKYANKILNEAQ